MEGAFQIRTNYSMNAGTRSDGEEILVTQNMHGYTAETWIGFLGNDERDAANSVYAGRMEL